MTPKLRNIKPIVLFLTLVILFSCNENEKTNIWLVGDSTMAAKSAKRYPESGWGEGLKTFVTNDATVHNHAASGRSTLSFINEGRWTNVLDSLSKGNYVIIQFGHNDEKTDPKLYTEPFRSFKANLTKFVNESREKGASPIICSSIVRRQFDDDGTLKDTHGDYIVAAKQVADETITPYVDMEGITRKMVQEMGPEESKKIFNYTTRKQDSTHVNVVGAEKIAALFVKDVKVQKIPIAKWLDFNSVINNN